MNYDDNTQILPGNNVCRFNSGGYNTFSSPYIHVEGSVDEMKSSPVRRTFCLLVLLDLAISFIFWILYVKIDYKTTIDGFNSEVKNYTFNTSLFDVAVISGFRFIYLEICYGAIKSQMPWFIAVSTAFNSVYIIVKIFMFDYKSNQASQSLIIICAINLISFLFCWIETLFLIYRVLPTEKAAEAMKGIERMWRNQIIISSNSGTPSQYSMDAGSITRWESMNRLSRSRGSLSGSTAFATPIETRSSSPTRVRQRELTSLAEQYKEHSWNLTNIANGWTYSTGDAVQGFISYRHMPEFTNKVFKLECLLAVSAEVIYKDMIFNIDQTPEWNSQIKSVQKLENISDNVDIIYNVTNEAMKGYVSPRDFVMLRVWGRHSKSFLICSRSHNFPEFPPEENIVRGETGLNIIRFDSLSNEDAQTKCTWILQNDLKVRMMNRVIERMLPGIYLELMESLRRRCLQINTPNM